ncbi:winged helix-turn-helix domain-containing protein [Halocatena marina]|uniref:winged helix-turn-helix domain-containing protein n=1 Tax=Halocatena marina TaxID=2934937 RepID=UPI0036122916
MIGTSVPTRFAGTVTNQEPMTSIAPDVGLAALREAFQLLANETRIEILHALWTRPTWEATFTELKTVVGMRDSGQFQYHLDKLVGTFIKRTDHGYTHLAGSIALYRAMLGTLGGPDSVSSIMLDTPCPACDRSLRLIYENQVFAARCPSCEESVLSSPFLPAGIIDRSNNELLSAFDTWSRKPVDLLQSGVCPWCRSTVSHTFEQRDDPEEVRITHRCDRCQGFLTTHVGEVILSDPAVVTFFYLLGRDITVPPYWSLPFCMTSNGVTVLSKAPWAVEQTIRYQGETLCLHLDDDMTTNVMECSLSVLGH